MEIRRAVQTGRILFLPVDKCDLYAEEFLSYIDEGFCPVFTGVADGKHLWEFAGYKVSDEGVVITGADTDLYTLPYKASQSDEGGSDTVTVWSCEGDNAVEMKVGDAFEGSLLNCDSCDVGEDEYFVGGRDGKPYIVIHSGDELTQEMLNLAVNGKLLINHSCVG